jgi:hypothetical protein
MLAFMATGADAQRRLAVPKGLENLVDLALAS